MKMHVNSAMIHNFIENRMTNDEVELFLNHLDHCKDCYDETEFYYMITVGLMRQDENIGLDLENSFSEFIKEKRMEIEKRDSKNDRRTLVITSAIMAALVLIYYTASVISARGSLYDTIGEFFEDTKTVILNELEHK